jgi:LmbE family N-acetylglucosaminyl deacetylase
MHPEHRTIGELAYRLWQARGCPDGTAEKDWLDAEKQLRSAQRAVDARADSRAPSRVDVSRVEVTRVDADTQRADTQRADPTQADTSRTRAPARPRRSKSTQVKPSSDPPS